MDLLAMRSRQHMAEMAVRLTQAGEAHLVPLISAAMDGALRFAIVAPGQRIPLRLLQDIPSRPLPVILAGDGETAVGLYAFPQARRLLRWARGIFPTIAAALSAKRYMEAAR